MVEPDPGESTQLNIEPRTLSSINPSIIVELLTDVAKVFAWVKIQGTPSSPFWNTVFLKILHFDWLFGYTWPSLLKIVVPTVENVHAHLHAKDQLHTTRGPQDITL